MKEAAAVGEKDKAQRGCESPQPAYWEIKQGARTFVISAAEFRRTSFDYGAFRPLAYADETQAAPAEQAQGAPRHGAAVEEALEAFKKSLLSDLEEPDEELLDAFQRAFVRQLARRKHKPELESAEKAGIRALLSLALSRERSAAAAKMGTGQG